jgi:hypothetical protein
VHAKKFACISPNVQVSFKLDRIQQQYQHAKLPRKSALTVEVGKWASGLWERVRKRGSNLIRVHPSFNGAARDYHDDVSWDEYLLTSREVEWAAAEVPLERTRSGSAGGGTECQASFR